MHPRRNQWILRRRALLRRILCLQEEEELLQEAMEAGKEMRSVNNKKWKKFRPPTV